ncbi:shikimate dehydrogenase [bacterium]|nr:shikimate dehydrogenase [bacterium]
MTDLYGIIGYPLHHTLSPAMQNAAFKAAGIDAHYVALSVAPNRIRAALRGLKSSGFAGFNVTVPYKETVLPFLDRISPEARSVGAVNTILARRGRWIGHNTDVHGFRMLIRRLKVRLKSARVLVYGAGGAARAVVSALIRDAECVMIQNRTARKARTLRDFFPAPHRRKIILVRQPEAVSGPALDLIVNATSVGLRPADRSIVPAAVLRKSRAAVDLIYNPPLTHFLRLAAAQGCRSANGFDMLLYQGALAFELWTGRSAPLSAMRRALRKTF